MAFIEMIGVDKEKLVEDLNSLIKEAIDHGGDLGGPYYSNPDDLINATNKILKTLELDNEYEIRWKGANDFDYCSMRLKYPVIRNKIII